MCREYRQLGSLPPDLQDTIMREFVPYSVALGRIVGQDASTFIPLGGGTICRKGQRVGILTAHHCLHACNPPVRVGPGGTDTLGLILRGGRTVVLNPEEAFELPLASPDGGAYNEWGPDLSFIQIAPGSRVGSVLAYGSAWSLDQNVNELNQRFGAVGDLLAAVGFPEELCNTEIRGNDVHRVAHHLTSINVIAANSVQEHCGWDFLTTLCDYSGTPTLPQSFEGVSGGGIWAIRLRRNHEQIAIADSALVGVSFYQSDLVDLQRSVRGHYIRSIYHTAWEGLQ